MNIRSNGKDIVIDLHKNGLMGQIHVHVSYTWFSTMRRSRVVQAVGLWAGVTGNPGSNPGHHVYRDSRGVHPLARWHKFVCHVPDVDIGRRNGRWTQHYYNYYYSEICTRQTFSTWCSLRTNKVQFHSSLDYSLANERFLVEILWRCFTAR